MDGSIVLNADPESLFSELEQAGFTRNEIGRALDWLEGLVRLQTEPSLQLTASNTLRNYSLEEIDHLTTEQRGLIIYLEQLGILDHHSREIVIDRLMAIDRREIDQSRVKWVVLLTLFNQPEKKAALTLLQEIILSDVLETLH